MIRKVCIRPNDVLTAGADIFCSLHGYITPWQCAYLVVKQCEHIALCPPYHCTMPVAWIGHTIEEMTSFLKQRYPNAEFIATP